MNNLVVDNLDILISREWLVVSSKNISIIDYMLIFTLLFAYTRSQALDQLLHNHFFITGVRWQKHISKKIQKKKDWDPCCWRYKTFTHKRTSCWQKFKELLGLFGLAICNTFLLQPNPITLKNVCFDPLRNRVSVKKRLETHGLLPQSSPQASA
jgi:hypothetical protein